MLGQRECERLALMGVCTLVGIGIVLGASVTAILYWVFR